MSDGFAKIFDMIINLNMKKEEVNDKSDHSNGKPRNSNVSTSL